MVQLVGCRRIKCNCLYFNSSMVRLVVWRLLKVFSASNLFQFQYGAIGSETLWQGHLRETNFNSSMVRLVGYGHLFIATR